MEERSYRLAGYQITLKGGEIWWKTHAGFGNAKSGKCFIEGDVLFIGPCEMDEAGFLKTEFFEFLRQFPQWEGTKYYCPSYTLFSCKGRRARSGLQHHSDHHPLRERKLQDNFHSLSPAPEKQEKITRSEQLPAEISPVKSKGGIALRSLSSVADIGQLKGKLGKAFDRCKGLVGLGSERDDSEE